MINRTIFNGKVYYSVADLADIFDVSPYKMRKAIKESKVETKNDIYGRTVFVLESDVAKINVYGEVKVLETNKELITADPEKKSNIVDADKFAKKKSYKQRKKDAQKKKEQAPVESVEKAQPEMSEGEKLHQELLNKSSELKKELVRTEKGDMYNNIYANYLGDDFKLDDSTSDDNEGLQKFVEALDNEVKSPSVQQSA